MKWFDGLLSSILDTEGLDCCARGPLPEGVYVGDKGFVFWSKDPCQRSEKPGLEDLWAHRPVSCPQLTLNPL